MRFGNYQVENEALNKFEEGAVVPDREVQTASPEQKAVVSIFAGVTVNMGNYETARINVGLALPCDVDDEKIEKAYAKVKEFVEKKLGAEVAELQAYRKTLQGAE